MEKIREDETILSMAYPELACRLREDRY